MLRSVALVRADVSEERRLLQEPHGKTAPEDGILQLILCSWNIFECAEPKTQ
jgi:hypothetical protein